MEHLAVSQPFIKASSERLEVATATDVGRERELNEDTVWGTSFDDGTDNPWRLSALLVVADGMGGHDAGEVASNLAVRTVREIFASPQTDLAPDDLSGQNLLRRVSEAVQRVNRVVYTRGEGNGAARPGTTLTLCLAREQEYVVGHVGDSRAYLARRNRIEQVSDDDSLVAESVRRGHMSDEEARGSQFRNQITKAVGLHPDVEPSVYYGHWQTGDVLLLCSDGLTEYVTGDEMLRHVQSGDSLQQICEALIALANERGGHDNISVAATRFLPAIGANAASQPARKPKTWPPANSPSGVSASSKSVSSPESTKPRISSGVTPSHKPGGKGEKRLPWLLIALVCGLLAAGGGLWLGLRTAVSGAAEKKVEKAKSDSTLMVAPPRQEATGNPTAQPKPQQIAPILSIGCDEKKRRFYIKCDGYRVQTEPSTRENITVGVKGANATIGLKSYANTVKELRAQARLLLFRNSKSDGAPIAESDPENVKILFGDVQVGKQYSLFFRPTKGARSRLWVRFKLLPNKA